MRLVNFKKSIQICKLLKLLDVLNFFFSVVFLCFFFFSTQMISWLINIRGLATVVISSLNECKDTDLSSSGIIHCKQTNQDQLNSVWNPTDFTRAEIFLWSNSRTGNETTSFFQCFFFSCLPMSWYLTVMLVSNVFQLLRVSLNIFFLF